MSTHSCCSCIVQDFRLMVQICMPMMLAVKKKSVYLIILIYIFFRGFYIKIIFHLTLLCTSSKFNIHSSGFSFHRIEKVIRCDSRLLLFSGRISIQLHGWTHLCTISRDVCPVGIGFCHSGHLKPFSLMIYAILLVWFTHCRYVCV